MLETAIRSMPSIWTGSRRTSCGAPPGERLRTLDGSSARDGPDDVVIADARQGHGVALRWRAYGWRQQRGHCRDDDVLLESATFDPRAVRRTAKRLGLHSEASHRFERGVDAAGIPVAGARAAARMAHLGGGRTAGPPLDRYPAPVQPRQLTLTTAALSRVAGFDIPGEIAVDRLRAIEIPAVVRGDVLVATVPTFRPYVRSTSI